MRYDRTPFHDELGKALADRMGVLHNMANRDYSVEGGTGTVLVTMTVGRIIPRAEYEELVQVALDRAKEAGR